MRTSNMINTWIRPLAALAAALLCSASLAASANFSASSLGDHLWLVRGPSGNTLVAEDNDGLILVDGVPAQHAREYLRFVREETGQQKVKTLINTHWHEAVTGLNERLGKAGVSIVAHENTKQWLAATIRERGEVIREPSPDKALPTDTFYETRSLPFRDGSIELGYMLQAHTDGDIYVRFPERNVLYTGDVLRSDDWAPVDETSNGFVGHMMDALDQMAGLIDGDTVIVPGSGPLLDQSEYTALVEMYKGLKAELVTLLRNAKSPDEVVAMNPAEGLRPEWGDPSAFLEEGFRSFYGHRRNARHVGGAIP